MNCWRRGEGGEEEGDHAPAAKTKNYHDAGVTLQSSLDAVTLVCCVFCPFGTGSQCGPCSGARKSPARIPGLLRLGETQIDFARQQAWRKKKPLHLTAKEFAMLRLMMETPGQPVSREKFLDVVWGYTAFPTTRTVDNHIASLRARLEPNPESPRWIKTVHGVAIGWRFPNETRKFVRELTRIKGIARRSRR